MSLELCNYKYNMKTERFIENGTFRLRSEVDVADYERMKAEYLELKEQINTMEYTDPQRYNKKVKAKAIGERIMRMIFRTKINGRKDNREQDMAVLMPVLSMVLEENKRINAHLPAYKRTLRYEQAMANILMSDNFDALDPVNKFVLQISDDCGINIIDIARRC